MGRGHRVIAGLIGGALLAFLAACDGSDKKPRPTPSPSVEERAVRASTAPDKGEVKVADSGFTATTADSGRLTAGVVVENTSKTWAVALDVEIRVFDSAGSQVQYEGRMIESEPVWVLLPGERAAVGLMRPGVGPEMAARMARLEVTLQPAIWWPASRMRKITISDVRQEKDADGKTWISYAVTSGYAQALVHPQVHVICRDQSNKIVGGVELITRDISWQPGRNEFRGEAGTLVSRLGASCAEVYGWPGPGTPGEP